MHHIAARFHGKIILIPLCTLVASTSLVGTVGPAFAQSTPNWQLQEVNRRKCFGTQVSPQHDFYVYLKGISTSPITVTITVLPPFAVYEGLSVGALIPPGSGDDTHVLAYSPIKMSRGMLHGARHSPSSPLTG